MALTRRILTTSLHYLPLIYVSLLLMVIAFYIFIAYLPFDGSHIQYSLVLLSRTTSIHVVLVAASSFIGLFFAGVALWGKLKGTQGAMYAAALILAFLSVPLSCWGSFSSFVEFGTGFLHVDRAYFDGALYQLSFISNPVGGKSSYNLYRCDDLGLDCSRVYQLDTSEGTLRANLGNFQTAEQIRLRSDSPGQSLSIVPEGTNIYDYHP